MDVPGHRSGCRVPVPSAGGRRVQIGVLGGIILGLFDCTLADCVWAKGMSSWLDGRAVYDTHDACQHDVLGEHHDHRGGCGC